MATTKHLLNSILLALVGAAGVFVLSNCGDDGGPDQGDFGDGGTTGSATTAGASSSGASATGMASGSGSGGVGPKLDVGPGGGVCPPPDNADASLHGTVYAPNGETPVSGALVYAAAERPEGIPDHVYCVECIEPPCEHSAVLTEPDGSFSMPLGSGLKYVVMQKGQFMRITEMDITPGPHTLTPAMTTLPDHRDPDAGLYIPNIALGWGIYDHMEDVLAKLGLADVDSGYFYAPGTENFDIWDRSAHPIPIPEYPREGLFSELLEDADRLAQYHIIFAACSAELDQFDVTQSPQAIDNLREWVAAGGRFYATDLDDDYLMDAFGQYQTIDVVPFGAAMPEYQATVVDTDLLAWLEALADLDLSPDLDGLPGITVGGGLTYVDATPPVLVDDGRGGQVDVGHHAFVTEMKPGVVPIPDQLPAAISAQYGCGKLMFTTYHTNPQPHVGLMPQELTMLYMILEIGVCQVPYEPPQ